MPLPVPLLSPCRPPAVPLPSPARSAAQENLLLSVLPAHISMGMKLTIIERLKGCGDRRYMPDNNFHSLYVKRHQNVRWAGGGVGCRVSPGKASLPPLWAVGAQSSELELGGLGQMAHPRQTSPPRASVCSSVEWEPCQGSGGCKVRGSSAWKSERR